MVLKQLAERHGFLGDYECNDKDGIVRKSKECRYSRTFALQSVNSAWYSHSIHIYAPFTLWHVLASEQYASRGKTIFRRDPVVVDGWWQ